MRGESGRACDHSDGQDDQMCCLTSATEEVVGLNTQLCRSPVVRRTSNRTSAEAEAEDEDADEDGLLLLLFFDMGAEWLWLWQ